MVWLVVSLICSAFTKTNVTEEEDQNGQIKSNNLASQPGLVYGAEIPLFLETM